MPDPARRLVCLQKVAVESSTQAWSLFDALGTERSSDGGGSGAAWPLETKAATPGGKVTPGKGVATAAPTEAARPAAPMVKPVDLVSALWSSLHHGC